MLAALNLLPEQVVLTIVGSGSDESRLRALAAPLGSRVRFETNATDEERNLWYAAADMCVVPSRDGGTDVEGFGIVFLEAAQAGLPVVAGMGGGVEEAVLDGQTGTLVDGTRPQQIAVAIHRYIEDQELRSEHGQAGKVRVAQLFQWHDRWELFKQTLSL